MKRFPSQLSALAFLLAATGAAAQETTVEPGRKTVALDEPYTITLVIKNTQQLNTHSVFPEIKGMQKRDIVLITSKETAGGKTLTVQRITQNYLAAKEGTYTLQDFAMTVNGREVRTKGGLITVTAPLDPNYKLRLDSTLAKEILEVENEYADNKDNAFLALSIDKPAVYVGEGFTASLALYIADDSPVALEAYRTGEQLVDILKKLKPRNCWEEDFHIREFQSFPVTIRARRYIQYKMYQATFYPFNTDTVRFGQVGLTMLARKPGSRKPEQQVLFSTPKQVAVRELPPHPLRRGIAVGQFRLEEAVSRKHPVTGRGFYYQFKVVGEGNFSAVNLPAVPSDAYFDFFPPESKLSLNLTGRRVTGSKLFQTYALPKEPGRYAWRNYFRWVFFNAQTHAYDTLRSTLAVTVGGESLRNQSISATELGTVYDRMKTEDNQLRPVEAQNNMRWVANGLVVVMMCVSLVLILWQHPPGGGKP